jgi:PAS domain S-box-containing protein
MSRIHAARQWVANGGALLRRMWAPAGHSSRAPEVRGEVPVDAYLAASSGEIELPRDALGGCGRSPGANTGEIPVLYPKFESSDAFATSVVETMPQAILVVGPGGRVVRANRHVLEMFGYREDEMLGQPVEILMAERYRSGHMALRGGFVHEAAPRMMGKNRDLQGLRKDGSEFPVEVGLGPMRRGHDQYVIVSIADISERQRFEQEVLRLNASLAELLRARTSELQTTEEALQVRTAELRTVLRRLSDAERRKVEAERRRLSQELHDEIGQMLTALGLNLEMVRRRCAAPEALGHLKNAVQIADSITRGVRDIVHQLRPPQLDDLGLSAALHWHLERIRQTSMLVVEFQENLGQSRLPAEIELASFRIVQESITNVLRHASASEVAVQLDYTPERLRLSITDDGVGFDAKPGSALDASESHLGLLGMQERVFGLGGRLRITSARAKGCRIEADIPLVSVNPVSRDDSANTDCRRPQAGDGGSGDVDC